MDISPSPIEKCEGKEVHVNVRIRDNRMDTFGDSVENMGGVIDWGDGTDEGISTCCSIDRSHVYLQAGTYYLSSAIAVQFHNADNPPGGCSYRCRLQQSATVEILPKDASKCK